MSTLKTILIIVISLLTISTANAQSIQSIGPFEYVEDKDEFTDKDRSFIINGSENGEAYIAWKCLSDGLNVVIVHDFMVGEDDEILVKYRFDDNKPSDLHSWNQKSNKLSYLDKDEVSGFTQSAKISYSLALRTVDPHDGEQRTFEFDLSESSRAINRLPCTN